MTELGSHRRLFVVFHRETAFQFRPPFSKPGQRKFNWRPPASILGHRSLSMPLFAFGRQKMARRQGLRRLHPLGLRADERQVATAAAPGVAVRSPTTRVPTPDCPPISGETAHAVARVVIGLPLPCPFRNQLALRATRPRAIRFDDDAIQLAVPSEDDLPMSSRLRRHSGLDSRDRVPIQ